MQETELEKENNERLGVEASSEQIFIMQLILLSASNFFDAISIPFTPVSSLKS
jgi:hypothetical protein